MVLNKLKLKWRSFVVGSSVFARKWSSAEEVEATETRSPAWTTDCRRGQLGITVQVLIFFHTGLLFLHLISALQNEKGHITGSCQGGVVCDWRMCRQCTHTGTHTDLGDRPWLALNLKHLLSREPVNMSNRVQSLTFQLFDALLASQQPLGDNQW